MAQVTECDRCKKVVHLLPGKSSASDLEEPMHVTIPHTRHIAGGMTELRETEKQELCAECLTGLERWFDQGVKE